MKRKLSDWEVWTARELYCYGISKWDQSGLADKFGVSESTIGKAIRNQGAYKGVIDSYFFSQYHDCFRNVRYVRFGNDIDKGEKIYKTLRELRYTFDQTIKRPDELPSDLINWPVKFYVLDTDNRCYMFISKHYDFKIKSEELFRTFFYRFLDPEEVSFEDIISWKVLPWPEKDNSITRGIPLRKNAL